MRLNPQSPGNFIFVQWKCSEIPIRKSVAQDIYKGLRRTSYVEGTLKLYQLLTENKVTRFHLLDLKLKVKSLLTHSVFLELN